ncbi:hypothetical protein G6F57_016392 [Rhizopus arrhizus]|nr:hypothetical protein G6F40_015912 [Rhizopus arrhizus]KAG1252119.1 hypothetical protein G6F68_011936 [Rhizopus microsporus]KAG1450486.1 hypothetical protein G6F57_016392 [Rhizopus arrhizus]
MFRALRARPMLVRSSGVDVRDGPAYLVVVPGHRVRAVWHPGAEHAAYPGPQRRARLPWQRAGNGGLPAGDAAGAGRVRGGPERAAAFLADAVRGAALRGRGLPGLAGAEGMA